MTDTETREEKFSVNIHMGNEAMQTAGDVARALREIADRLDNDGGSGFYETIFDDNGNDVGRFKLGYDR